MPELWWLCTVCRYPSLLPTVPGLPAAQILGTLTDPAQLQPLLQGIVSCLRTAVVQLRTLAAALPRPEDRVGATA